MSDPSINPITQPLSPVARNAKLVTIQSVARAILELTADGAPSLTDTDVNDIGQDLNEVGLKWFDKLEPFYSRRLDPTVNLDADIEGVDYTIATGIAAIAATIMSTERLLAAVQGQALPAASPTMEDRAKAIGEAMILQKMSYDAVQSTDDPPTEVPAG